MTLTLPWSEQGTNRSMVKAHVIMRPMDVTQPTPPELTMPACSSRVISYSFFDELHSMESPWLVATKIGASLASLGPAFGGHSKVVEEHGLGVVLGSHLLVSWFLF